jgi:hypothetical protein
VSLLAATGKRSIGRRPQGSCRHPSRRS